MTHKYLLMLIAVFFCSSKLYAHALWIETNPVGIKGKSQEIRIFFGEFSENDVTATDKWFSDLKDFSLYVISPTGKKTILTSQPTTNYYQSAFTPYEDGVYTVAMHHTVKELYDSMKLDYNSSATVVIGNLLKGNDVFNNPNIAALFSASASQLKVNQAIVLAAVYSNKLAAEQEVEVFAPNGWGKKLYSDERGEITVTPLWKGKYMVEFSVTENTDGSHYGKAYHKVWRAVTYILHVK